MLAMGNNAGLADRLALPPSMQNGRQSRGGWEGQSLSIPKQGGTYSNSYGMHGHFGGGFPSQGPPSPYFRPVGGAPGWHPGGWGGYPPASPAGGYQQASSMYSTPTNQHARASDIYSSIGDTRTRIYSSIGDMPVQQKCA